MPKHTALHPYAVYHATNLLAMLRPDPRAWQTDRDRQYRHVANVYAERSQVFAITNRTEGLEWTERPEVFWVAPGTSPRSTSVLGHVRVYELEVVVQRIHATAHSPVGSFLAHHITTITGREENEYFVPYEVRSGTLSDRWSSLEPP